MGPQIKLKMGTELRKLHDTKVIKVITHPFYRVEKQHYIFDDGYLIFQFKDIPFSFSITFASHFPQQRKQSIYNDAKYKGNRNRTLREDSLNYFVLIPAHLVSSDKIIIIIN